MQFHKSFIEHENENVEEQVTEDKEKPSIFRKILRNRKVRQFTFFVVFAITVPILVFYFVVDQRDYTEPDRSYTCLVGSSYRVACGKVNITAQDCYYVACCYDSKTTECYHSIPSKHIYTKCNDSTSKDCRFRPSRPVTPFLNESLPELKLSLIERNSNALQIILHTPTTSYKTEPIQNKKYHAKLQNDLLGVEVFRTETEERLLTTFRGPSIASEGYWEWTFQLTNEKLFGLGELAMEENKTITKVIYKNKNDHNTIPSFMAYLNGSFHGVVVEHDGPLEVTVLRSKLIVLKSLAGNRIVLNLFVGPTPEDVMKQQRLYKPVSPPYWALGAHICRGGKSTIDSAIAEYKEFAESEHEIQFASDCIHENLYAMLGDVKEEHDLKNLIQNLQAKSHFLMSIPPQILKGNSLLYKKAVELDLLYKDNEGKILYGIYLQQEVAYPDFTHDSINMWFSELTASLPVFPNGFVLRDNWPEEESYMFSNENYKFPYLTEELNSSLSRTIPWNAVSQNIQHMINHNHYGASQAAAFKKNMDSEFRMTSSYDYGVEDAALVQNVNISWSNLKKAITTTLYHSIFGNPLISIPVCGSTNNYNKDSHEEICIRWYLTAATFPLFRISSDFPRRDPTNLATEFAKDVALKAIEKRNMLLPYYYTILSNGDPLVRPMFYDFYFDNNTFALDEQYMLGKGLLVAQPVLPGITNMRIYFPPSVKTWYEFWGGRKCNGTGWINNIHIVEADWVMFAAEGHIIPLRNHKTVDAGSGKGEDTFSLAVALNCTSNPCRSQGSLKLHSTSLTFSGSETVLTVGNVDQAKSDLGCNDLTRSSWPRFIEKAIIYGIKDTVVYSNFLSVNLCEVTGNSIDIKYFQKK